MKKKFFDLSVPVHQNMVHWPGDPDVEIKRLSSIADGATANVSAINFGLHTGTHMDAPLHFIDNSDDITKVPLDILIGKARVIKIDNPHFIGKEEIEKKIRPGDTRILFHTRNSDHEWYNENFSRDYVYVDESGADFLVSKGIKLVGVDYLSVAEFKKGKAVHQALLGNNTWIIEGLYFRDVPEGEYDLAALPLKVAGADGAPVRVILSEP